MSPAGLVCFDDRPVRRQGNWTRSSLRSRKRSGSQSGCDTQRVLEVFDPDAGVLGEIGEGLTGLEAIDHVADLAPPWTNMGWPNALEGSTTTWRSW